MKGLLVGGACLFLFACASEQWDNRFDPESDSYRSTCEGVPEAFATGCVLWEDFDGGLGRWLITESPEGVGRPSIAARGPYGNVPDVLALPGCDGDGPSLATEVIMPGGEVQISAIWAEGEATNGQLAIGVGSRALEAAEGPAEEDGFEGWRESITTLVTTPGQSVVLRLVNGGGAGTDCDLIGLYVARFVIQERLE